ncbi:unnamed protein product [Acanthoscelides obtectus]|uniref:Uncharacterized protein n=1 Tax=Acanthoscelides obtectus TaxID=200917 RepID=A0A9P0JPG8_ACAOB|nr:unnamed protein product [Acanthoscelides obtectus]CAK1679109.1 hypothetical protein AOBTE_LOCUS32129 [Acanthoscelides obtectus]
MQKIMMNSWKTLWTEVIAVMSGLMRQSSICSLDTLITKSITNHHKIIHLKSRVVASKVIMLHQVRKEKQGILISTNTKKRRNGLVSISKIQISKTECNLIKLNYQQVVENTRFVQTMNFYYFCMVISCRTLSS